jgi:hypothetical protein
VVCRPDGPPMGLRIEGRFQTSTTPASARSCLASPQKQPNARTKGQDRQCKRCEGCDFVAALWNENRAATSVHTGAAEPVEVNEAGVLGHLQCNCEHVGLSSGRGLPERHAT